MGLDRCLIPLIQWTAKEWREVLHNVQTIAIKYNTQIPLLYGLDSIHGASYVKDATIFPQQINIAASFDPINAFYVANIHVFNDFNMCVLFIATGGARLGIRNNSTKERCWSSRNKW